MDANGRSQFGANSTIRLYNLSGDHDWTGLSRNRKFRDSSQTLLGGFVLSWFACLGLGGLAAPTLLNCKSNESVGHWLVRQVNCSTDPAFVQAIGPTSRRTLRNLPSACIPNPHGYRCPSSEPTTPTGYRRANLTMDPSDSSASDWLSVTKTSWVFQCRGRRCCPRWHLGKRGERVA